MTISVLWESPGEPLPGMEALIKNVILEACGQEGCPFEAEVTVIFTDNEEIQQANQSFRGIDRPTDVLSFPLVDFSAPSAFSGLDKMKMEYFNPETEELVLGDIMISVEQAQVQAESYGHSLEREIGFLTAHSMLHLFGYDHMEEKERILMEEKQERILCSLGLKR